MIPTHLFFNKIELPMMVLHPIGPQWYVSRHPKAIAIPTLLGLNLVGTAISIHHRDPSQTWPWAESRSQLVPQ